MNLGDEFRAGAESAKIRTHGNALVRAVQVGGAIAVALFTPVVWWGKLLIFLGVMFLIGVVVQYREIRRIDRG